MKILDLQRNLYLSKLKHSIKFVYVFISIPCEQRVHRLNLFMIYIERPLGSVGQDVGYGRMSCGSSPAGRYFLSVVHLALCQCSLSQFCAHVIVLEMGMTRTASHQTSVHFLDIKLLCCHELNSGGRSPNRKYCFTIVRRSVRYRSQFLDSVQIWFFG